MKLFKATSQEGHHLLVCAPDEYIASLRAACLFLIVGIKVNPQDLHLDAL